MTQPGNNLLSDAERRVNLAFSEYRAALQARAQVEATLGVGYRRSVCLLVRVDPAAGQDTCAACLAAV